MARFGRSFPVPVQRSRRTPFLVQFGNAGTFSYVVPAGFGFVDVILIGGGAGGYGGGVAGNVGGGAGVFASTTLNVGTTIFSGATITVAVGAGGAAGGMYGSPGAGAGGSTTATAIGWSGLTAAGGAVASSGSRNGGTPGTFVYDSQSYVGGAQNSAPGGGGSCGAYGFYQGGANGGQGAAWFYAY